MEGLAKDENQIILPKDITDYDSLMKGLALDKPERVLTDKTN